MHHRPRAEEIAMRTSRSRARVGVLAALLATAAIVTAAPARAGIVAYATRSYGQGVLDSTVYTVALSDAGASSLAFKATAAGQLFQITFNAECHVFATTSNIGVGDPAVQAWVGIVFKVNGQPLQPYEPGDTSNVTLCSNVWENFPGKQTLHAGFYVSASRVAVFKAPAAGTYTLTVQTQGRVNGSSTAYYNLDDIVVTIIN
jgi:hypothetical protein